MKLMNKRLPSINLEMNQANKNKLFNNSNMKLKNRNKIKTIMKNKQMN